MPIPGWRRMRGMSDSWPGIVAITQPRPGLLTWVCWCGRSRELPDNGGDEETRNRVAVASLCRHLRETHEVAV
jgi:hypothetical protein